MIITYRSRVSIPLPAANTAVSSGRSIAARPRGVALSGTTGALAGAAGGVAVGVGAPGFVPGIGLGMFIAMGLRFGAFNGGLIGILARLDGR